MFTYLILPNLPIKTPYGVTWNLPEVKPNPDGFVVMQMRGFNSVEKILSLQYVNITEVELNSVLALFDDTDANKLLQVDIPNELSYKLTKPTSYEVEEMRIVEGGLWITKYKLSFKARIVE
jgi:hypothetical protein